MMPAMRYGRRLQTTESLPMMRERAQKSLAAMPLPLRSLNQSAAYPVEISKEVRKLAAELDRLTG
jgi:hypothetical protein